MKIYRVGGFVRDTLMGLVPKDVDYVVVGATHEEMIAQGFSKVGAAFPVYLHPKTGDEYALARREKKVGVGYNGFDVEFSPDVTLEEDLSRRDLTMNAMAMDDDGNVIDPFNGRADIEAGVLRHVSDAFAEDPIRVLRTARFAARYNFEVHEDTLELMGKIAHELEFVPKERIWAEFEKGMSEKFPDKMGDVLWKSRAMSTPVLRPYQGFGHRGLDFAESDTLVSRFAILGGNFREDDFETYKIPTDFVRVHQAVGKYNAILSAWPYVSVDHRLKVLSEMRAFNDPSLVWKTIDALSIWRRKDFHADWAEWIRAFVEHDLSVAKTVDTEAIAKMAPSPKMISQLIHNARCEALEADPDSQQKVIPK